MFWILSDLVCLAQLKNVVVRVDIAYVVVLVRVPHLECAERPLLHPFGARDDEARPRQFSALRLFISISNELEDYHARRMK